jgi:DNA-binding transcriptional LysR family regulator
MIDLDLRLVRYFEAVCRHLHFGRAAEELFVSQPALSQGIAKLEKRLELQLFERSQRQVSLTPAGRELRVEAEQMLRAERSMVSVAQRLGRDQLSRFDVGYIAAPGHMMSPITLRAQQAMPTTRIDTRRLEWSDQEMAVVNGQVDVSFARTPITHPDLDQMIVASEPLVVGLPATHPLAERDRVFIADILHEPVLTSESCPSEEWRLWWALAEHRRGVPITWGPIVDTVEDMFQHAALGHAIVITAYSVMGSYSHPMVTFKPLVDAPRTTVALCWLRDRQLPLLQQFLAVARDVVGAAEIELDVAV